MIDLVLTLIKVLLIILSPVLVPITFILITLSCVFIFRYLYTFAIKKHPLPKVGKYKKPSIFKRLYVEFPRQFIIDLKNKKDYEFNEWGVHVVVGQQGAGKTTTVVHLLKVWEQKYPHMKVTTNMAYKGEHSSLNHWKDIMDLNNQHFGHAVVIDEIQTWFNSLQSKDFPPEMLQEISQQRKQRKAIIGTAQLFNRIGKPIREQTHFVYIPMTFLGCLTWVRKSESRFWDEEKQRFKRYTGHYFFVHNSDIRDSFDTLKKIEKYKQQGFKPDADQIRNQENKIRFVK